MRCRDAHGNKKVGAFAALWHDSPVIDGIGLKPFKRHAGRILAVVFDIAFIEDKALFRDISTAIMGVHAVRGKRNRSGGDPFAAAIHFGHHIFAEHAPRLADIKLILPAAAALSHELVLAHAPARNLVADPLGNAGIVGKCPHKSLLVFQMPERYHFALGVRCFGPAVGAAYEVRRETGAVVGVGLAVRHRRVYPRHAIVTRIERSGLQIPEQQLVVEFAVSLRLFERNHVARIVGKAHAIAVRLNPAVAGAVWRINVNFNTGQESAGRIALPDIRINALVELMVLHPGALDAVDRLAVL